jgi:peptide-methionine (R)-S-oxide reductase
MKRRNFILSVGAVGALLGLSKLPLASTVLMQDGPKRRDNSRKPDTGSDAVDKGVEKVTTRVTKTNEEWRRVLTPDQYSVTREQGTERPYSSPLNDNHETGIFECVCCGLPLFSSKAKFDSGTGWPSFYEPIVKENVREKIDKSLWMTRTEVLCARCDAHLGHVFDDGPKPTGLRYCMNGVALKFVAEALQSA